VLTSGIFILGPEVESFESEWSQFCGVSGSAGVNSGTDALTLALIASGVVKKLRGDEVITSPLTAAYTALAILNAGAVPVFADIDPRTYTLDPIAVERAITPRTRAIIPVHLYGQMADMHALRDLAARRGLVVIEDAAQAHGASVQGKRAGSQTHAAVFSF
jgi:dTDP-4-amino-4,6-dideoxygalactose transaminase